jgi:hypothetical protein
MNAQRLIAGFRVCTMAVQPFYGRLLPKHCVVIAAMILALAACAVSVCANEYDIIIEKNLFHDQRLKWEMEKSQAKGSSGPREKQNIDQINLFGTVIKDADSYAVMRVKQNPDQQASQRTAARRARREAGADQRAAQGGEQNQENKRPYAVGDFISGYQVVEIKSGSVLLQDPYDSKRYEIFMNASPAERTAVKTEIVEDKPATPPPASGRDRKTPVKPQARSAAPPNPDADPMRQRFERNMQNIPEDKSDAVPEQSERDWESLQPMMPDLDEKGQEELELLKSEFEKMRQ